MFQATSDCATLHHTRINFCRATSRATKVAPCMVALKQRILLFLVESRGSLSGQQQATGEQKILATYKFNTCHIR